MSKSQSEFESFTSQTLVLPRENIDTDQIIPARYITTTSRQDLGRFAFHDWRYDGSGQQRPDEPLNAHDAERFQILVAGRNFGCGSSREHAAWALRDFGIRAVISSEIADIFRSNAMRSGVLPIIAPTTAHTWLLDHPGAELTIKLGEQRVHIDEAAGFDFEIDAFAKHCLLENIDELGFLLTHSSAIDQYEAATE